MFSGVVFSGVVFSGAVGLCIEATEQKELNKKMNSLGMGLYVCFGREW